VCQNICAYTDTCMHAHMCVCMYITHIHRLRNPTIPNARAPLPRTCIHTHTYKPIHSYKHIHTYTHTKTTQTHHSIHLSATSRRKTYIHSYTHIDNTSLPFPMSERYFQGQAPSRDNTYIHTFTHTWTTHRQHNLTIPDTWALLPGPSSLTR
jgi:hypothetical protein